MADPLRVIWCDVGGVLTSSVTEAVAALVERAGVTRSDLHRAIEAAAAEHGLTGMQPLELGRTTQAAWGARVASHLPRPPRIDLRYWDQHWYRDRRPEPALLAELGRCRALGVQVGILTNSVAEWEPHRLRLLGPLRVDAVIRSHEVGLAKPDPAIYALAERTLPAPPDATLLIDDTLENCRAAHRRGWRVLHHRSAAATIAALGATWAPPS